MASQTLGLDQIALLISDAIIKTSLSKALTREVPPLASPMPRG
jgi:hypothetical protein